MATEQDLLTHFEAHLGPLRTRFLPAGQSSAVPCQYLRFEDTPAAECTTIVTLGLSRHILPQKSGRMVRQELIICTYSAAFDAQFVSALDVVAREMDEMHRSLSRGQVVSHGGPLLPHTTLEAFVVMNPWYWDDEFSCFSGVVPPAYMAWLVPITKEEVECIQREGVDAFEAAIESQDPDLLDLRRESMRV